ncbi:hypothetical protein CCP3SC15_710008 [Gammaproteobacteria bacterium]
MRQSELLTVKKQLTAYREELLQRGDQLDASAERAAIAQNRHRTGTGQTNEALAGLGLSREGDYRREYGFDDSGNPVLKRGGHGSVDDVAGLLALSGRDRAVALRQRRTENRSEAIFSAKMQALASGENVTLSDSEKKRFADIRAKVASEMRKEQGFSSAADQRTAYSKRLQAELSRVTKELDGGRLNADMEAVRKLLDERLPSGETK